MESADMQQVHLFHRQWTLIKDQMAVFSRELAVIRQDAMDMQISTTRNESNLREVADSAGVAISNMRNEFEQKVQGIKMSLEQGYQDHHHKYQSGLQSVEAQMNRLMAEHQSHQGSVRELLESNKLSLEKTLGNERNGRELHRTELSTKMAELDKVLKMEVMKVSNEHQANHAQTRDMVMDHKGSTEKQLAGHRAGFEEMLETTKRELSRMTADNSATRDAFGEHKSSVDRHIGGSASAHDEHRRAVQDLEAQLRRELLQLSAEGQSNHVSVKEMFEQHRQGFDRSLEEQRAAHDQHKSRTDGVCSNLEKKIQLDMQRVAEDLRGEHRGALDSGLASEQAARDEHRRALAADLEALSKDMRGEMENFAGDHSAELARLSGDHSDRHAALEGAFGAHRAGLEAHLHQLYASERDARAEVVKEAELRFQAELGNLAQGHSAVHADLRADLTRFSEDKTDLNQVRTDLEAAIADASSALRGDLSSHRSEHAGNHEALKGALSELDAAIRADLADHGSRHASLNDSLLQHQDSATASMQAIRAELIGHGSRHASLVDTLSAHQNATELSRAETLERLRGLDRELRAELQTCSNIHGGNHDKIADTLRELEQVMIGRHTALDEGMGGRLQEAKTSMDARIEIGIAELTQALTEASAGHSAGLSKVRSDHELHRSEMDSSLKGHHESLQEVLSQEKAERFRHHASLTERLDVIESALVREDEELRERIQAALPENGVTREEYEFELQRVWQALDGHTHAMTTEEIRPPPVMEIIEPVMLPQQPLAPSGSFVMAQQRPVMSVRSQPQIATMGTPRISGVLQAPQPITSVVNASVVRAQTAHQVPNRGSGTRLQDLEVFTVK